MNRSNETIYEATTSGPIDPDGYSHFAAFDSPWESGIDNRTDNATKIDYFYFYEHIFYVGLPVKWIQCGLATSCPDARPPNKFLQLVINSKYFAQEVQRKEQLAMLWILFVSIIFGNCSVLMTLVFSKGRGSRFRYFIKHLAIADLSVGLVSVLTDIIWKFTVEWKAGNIACKIVRYSQVVVTYSSTYILVALTIDRYDAITHPMNFSKGWKRAKILVSTAWLLSFLFSVPIIVLYEEKSIEGHIQCWIDLLESWHWQVYMTLISLTVFFIPACIIATCYSFIIYTIWSKTNIMKQDGTSRHTFGEVSGSNSMDADCRRVSSRGLIPKAKIKTIKMTLIIVFVFIFCWSPYMIFDLLQVFGYIEKTQSNIALATFIQSLAPLNSAANPIIYCTFSPFVCHVQRKSVVLQCLTRWCFQKSQFGTGRKITDTATFSNVSRTSKNNANLHNLSGVKNTSRANKTNRASGASWNRLESRKGRSPQPEQKGIFDSYFHPGFSKPFQIKSDQPRDRESKRERFGGSGKRMTLKTHLSGLSERAKAFSVENLIRARQDERTDKSDRGTEGKRREPRMKTWNNLTVELCSSDLWEKFSEIGTEMIVTKAGRRMFPTLKVRFHGLSISTTYIVYMDIIPVGETRFRYIYHSSKWMAAGTSEVYSGNNIYVHPDSPATGQLWTSQGHISFDKIKLTNNKSPIMTGQVSLNSMHKYQPRIHILEVPLSDNLRLNSASEVMEYIRENRERTAVFTFKQTAFITVTAYQNQDITKLKIQSNPFAKGFREPSKSRCPLNTLPVFETPSE